MLIRNATIITFGSPNKILPAYGLRIANGKVVDVGPSQEIVDRYPGEEIIDARGQYVLPGNICAHTHFYGAFARGMAIPGSAPKDFPEILSRLWWSLDKALTEDDIYFSALVCLVDAIKQGTTTLIDHHASPNQITGSLDVIAKAVGESGLRAALCYEVTDRNGVGKAQEGIAENLRFIRKIKEKNPLPGRLAAMFGLHAGLTLSDATLHDCVTAVAGLDTGFHIHVAEHIIDEYDSVEKSGQRVVDRLNDFGILGPKSIVAHAVCIDAREMSILAQTGTWVTHQPRSNMNNGVCLPRVEEMLRSGIRVCLGNDGFSNSMWEEWKAAYFGHKLIHRDPQSMPAHQVMEMAIYNNRDLARTLFDELDMGVIAPGAAADIIFVDYHPYTPLNEDNLPWHIVFGFQDSMVTTTIVLGKVLMRDRQVLILDETKMAEEAQQRASRTWQRYSRIAQQPIPGS